VKKRKKANPHDKKTASAEKQKLPESTMRNKKFCHAELELVYEVAWFQHLATFYLQIPKSWSLDHTVFLLALNSE